MNTRRLAASALAAGAPEATGNPDSLIRGRMFTADAQIAFVGQATIDRAGQAGQWSHLQSPPS